MVDTTYVISKMRMSITEQQNVQIEEMSRCDMVVLPLSLGQLRRQALHRLMHVHHSVDNGLSMRWWDWKIPINGWEGCAGYVGCHIKIESLSELEANLVEGLVRPVTKPVEYTTVEKSRGCCSSRR